jgi:hypothetical protein
MNGCRPVDLILIALPKRRIPRRGIRRWLRWLAVCWGLI